MQTLFQKMRANRGRWVDQPIRAAEVHPAPEVPFMVVDGQRYVEKRGPTCYGCSFIGVACTRAVDIAEKTFGGRCSDRSVIYLKAE